MRLTLSLHDYLCQYLLNVSDQDTHCPVCYQQELTFDTLKDITHVTNCYKQDLLYLTLEQHLKTHGELPGGMQLDGVVSRVERRVDQQMINCASLLESVASHQSLES